MIRPGHALPLVAIGLFAAVDRRGEQDVLPLGRGDAYGLIDDAQLRKNGQHSRIGGDVVPELIGDHATHGQAVLFQLDRCDAVGVLISARDVRPLIRPGHALPLVTVGLCAANGRRGEQGFLPLGRGDAYGLIDDAQLHGKQQTHMVI